MTTVSHREFLRDITASATPNAFKIESFVVQPGLTDVFPWLSTIAQNYEQYYIHGIQFFFRSAAGDSTTSGAQGNVILAAEYNVNSSAYINKQYMENSEGAKSVKQSNSIGLTLKNVDRTLFTRNSVIPTGDSLKFYDHSIFQIATQGFPDANFNAGELWVAYKITFLKPQIPRNLGGNIETLAVQRVGTATEPFGTVTLSNKGSISVTFLTLTTFRLDGLTNGAIYNIQLIWKNGGSAVTPALDFTISNSNAVLGYTAGTQSTITVNFLRASSAEYWIAKYFTPTTNTVTITQNGLAYPQNAGFELYVYEIDRGAI